MQVSLEMESISHTVEKPPDKQIEGEPSNEASLAPGSPAGSQPRHQRRGSKKKYQKYIQGGQNPSLVGQSGSKGRAQRCLENCTAFARTIFCQGRAKLMPLIKFCSSVFDIGTDILQGKGTFKNYTHTFQIFYPNL